MTLYATSLFLRGFINTQCDFLISTVSYRNGKKERETVSLKGIFYAYIKYT